MTLNVYLYACIPFPPLQNRLHYRVRNKFVAGTSVGGSFQVFCGSAGADPLPLPTFDGSMFAVPQMYVRIYFTAWICVRWAGGGDAGHCTCGLAVLWGLVELPNG